MKFNKVLILLCSVLFFFAALTLYLNRVIFPQMIKKIAIERIEDALKRKAEIGSIHFNWVRGFIIDKIKIYEKNSTDKVFAQAEQVSFGIIFFPGIKHYRITIPFINVRSPSVHLIRTGVDTWNFSDILTPAAPPTPNPHPSKPEKPSPFELAWGGITVSNGQFLVDDLSTPRQWSEFFNNINLKLSLSYKGIHYDFTADIPGKKGFVGATVYYQPITKYTQAQIRLKNIDTASYLSLVNIPDVHIETGIIDEINLNINYTQDKTSAQGDVVMKNLNITNNDQTFKGNIDIHDLDAQYEHGDISARGQLSLSDIQTHVPGLSAGGSVQAKVNEFEYTQDGVNFNGSLHAQHIFVNLKDRQVKVDGVILDDIKVKKDNNGIQSVGSIETKGLFVQWPDQKLEGDISIKNISMRMKDLDDINVQGEIQADNLSTSIGDKDFSSQHMLFEDLELNILDQKNVSISTKLSLDNMQFELGRISFNAGSLKTDRLSFSLIDGMIKAHSTLNSSKSKLVMDDHKIIEADPQLEINLQMPLNEPQRMIYKGSLTLSGGHIRGFVPVQYLDNVDLDVDFENDEATINALSADILDTNIRVTGSVKNFKNPILNIIVETDELNLAKIHDLAPQLVDQYGLNFDGTSTAKIKFEGLASDPLAGRILAVLTVKHVSASSSKFHQKISNITGIIEATPNSLKWRDFTALYQGQQYSLSGSMNNFKNPRIITTIDGPNINLKADIVKDHDLITINTLTGKYMNAAFDSKGTITLAADNGPVFNIDSTMTFLLEDLIKALPDQQKKGLLPLNPTGMIHVTANLKGTAMDWKNYTLNSTITSPVITLLGYKLTDMKTSINQEEGKVKNLTFDGKLYDGTVHAVGSLNLADRNMPYDLALNIDNTDMHLLKMDSPLKMEEIDGKFYLTTIAHGTITDFKNNLHATGSLAIRDGFLAEFNLFKGLLGILNDVMRLGQVEITDVEGNFTIDDQKINTDNLRLKGPTIVLLGKGWVNLDQTCDLNVTVDLSSGVVPAIAHDVLNTLNIRIYDKIANPKFKKKISVPQVINTLLKNLLQ
jgi:hypothetical protein